MENRIILAVVVLAALILLARIWRIGLLPKRKRIIARDDQEALPISVSNFCLIMPCTGQIVHVDETVSHYRLIVRARAGSTLYYPANGQLANSSMHVNDAEENARDAARYIQRGGVVLGKNYEGRPFNTLINKPQNSYYILLNNGPVIHLSTDASHSPAPKKIFQAGEVLSQLNTQDTLTSLTTQDTSAYVSLLFPKMDFSDGYFKFTPEATEPGEIPAGEILGHYVKNRFSAGLANSEYEDVSSLGPWGLYMNAIFSQGPKN